MTFTSPDGKIFKSKRSVYNHLLGVSSSAGGGGGAGAGGGGSGSSRGGGGALWVECCRCQKWRKLHGQAVKSVPAVWYCEMNPDPLHDDCSHEQEEYDDSEEDESVEKEVQEVEARVLLLLLPRQHPSLVAPPHSVA